MLFPVVLVTRLISSADSSHVLRCSYLFLAQARGVSLRWTREITSVLQQADEDDITELQIRAYEVAYICHATFDLDKDCLPEVFSSTEDIAAYIECGLVLDENQPTLLSAAPLHIQRMFLRGQRLAHKAQSCLRARIQEDRAGFDQALLSVWPDYLPSDKPLKFISNQWIQLETIIRENTRSQLVSYDVLRGKLLVDGSPLGRLPQEIMSHPFYQRTFGQVSTTRSLF
jgi:hypothetical protein